MPETTTFTEHPAELMQDLVWGAYGLAAVLALFAICVGVYVFVVGKERHPTIKGFMSVIGSLIWTLPVLLVLGLVVYRARGMEEVPQTREENSTSLDIDLGKPGELDAVPFAPDTKEKKTAETKDKTEAAADLPNWVKQIRVEDGTTTRYVLTSKQWATVEEAERELTEQAKLLLKTEFPTERSPKAEWDISDEFVTSDNVRTNQYIEEITRTAGDNEFVMQRVYWQITISPEVIAKLRPVWKKQVVEERLWSIGTVLAVLTLILVTAASYFRLDLLTAGQYRKRLKLAAVSLIVAGGLAAATLV